MYESKMMDGQNHISIQPKRQKLGSKQFGSSLGWSYLAIGAGTCFLIGYFSAFPSQTWDIESIFIIAMVISCYAIGFYILARLGVVVLFNFFLMRLGRRIRNTITNNNSQIAFWRGDEERLRCDANSIKSVNIYSNNRNFQSISSGIGFKFTNLNGLEASEDVRLKLSRHAKRSPSGDHIFLNSALIGTQKQNEEFVEWLEQLPIAQCLKEVNVHPKFMFAWTREAWFLFVFVTFGLVSLTVALLLTE